MKLRLLVPIAFAITLAGFLFDWFSIYTGPVDLIPTGWGLVTGQIDTYGYIGGEHHVRAAPPDLAAQIVLGAGGVGLLGNLVFLKARGASILGMFASAVGFLSAAYLAFNAYSQVEASPRLPGAVADPELQLGIGFGITIVGLALAFILSKMRFDGQASFTMAGLRESILPGKDSPASAVE